MRSAIQIAWLLAALAPFGAARGEVFESFTEPVQTIEVACADFGRVSEIAVRRGDTVAKGELLLSLDSKLLNAARRIAAARAGGRAKTAALEVERKLKQSRLAKLRQLRGSVSPEELNRAEAELEIASYQLAAAREDQQLLDLQLAEIDQRIEQRRTRSPVAGVVIDVLKEPGEHVSAAEPHVVTIVRLSSLRATFHLPPALAATLRANGRLPVRFPATGESRSAVVEHASQVIDAGSGRVRVDLLIENAQRGNRAGARCQIELNANAAPNRSYP